MEQFDASVPDRRQGRWGRAGCDPGWQMTPPSAPPRRAAGGQETHVLNLLLKVDVTDQLHNLTPARQAGRAADSACCGAVSAPRTHHAAAAGRCMSITSREWHTDKTSNLTKPYKAIPLGFVGGNVLVFCMSHLQAQLLNHAHDGLGLLRGYVVVIAEQRLLSDAHQAKQVRHRLHTGTKDNQADALTAPVESSISNLIPSHHWFE